MYGHETLHPRGLNWTAHLSPAGRIVSVGRFWSRSAIVANGRGIRRSTTAWIILILSLFLVL